MIKLQRREVKPKFEMVLEPKTLEDRVTETVNLRELHTKLGSGDKFADWIKFRIEQYDFIENKDYLIFRELPKNSTVGRPRVEYYGTLTMAKELAMVENNAMGKVARHYFIRCEEQLKEEQIKVSRYKDPFNLEDLGNDMLQVNVAVRQNQKLTRTRLMCVLARRLRCGRPWIQRLTNEIYKTLLDCPNATARNFREHMNLPQISAVYLTRDQLEGHIQILVSGIEQAMLILYFADITITFGELREYALGQAKISHKQLLRIVQQPPSALVFAHEYNIVPILPYRERRMQAA